MLRVFFNRRWWWTTLLVVAATSVMLRLGFWQLERLGQRRAFNADISRRLQTPPLALDADPTGLGDLSGMKYRPVVARGEYDYSQEITLVNQNWEGQPGVHLVTPLIIEGSEQAVLVDRGWIPYADAAPEHWGKYAEPGPVEVKGTIWLADSKLETRGNGAASDRTWFWVDVDGIQARASRPLLPFYIQQSPEPGRDTLPHRIEPDVQLSEGRHLEYIITWFSLAAVLGVGYVRYVLRLSPPAAKRAPGGARFNLAPRVLTKEKELK